MLFHLIYFKVIYGKLSKKVIKNLSYIYFLILIVIALDFGLILNLLHSILIKTKSNLL